jgi:glucose/mannose-6-phosphate isomerase
MVEAIRTLPGQFVQGWEMAESAAARCAESTKARAPSRVVLCGMGGSAFPGELVALAFPSLDLVVCRDYRPYGRPLDADTLVIASSFSGNTEETLAFFRYALGSSAQVCAVTAGGKLTAEAMAAGCPLVSLSCPWPGFQPRAATGFFVGAIARLVESAGLIEGGLRVFEALDRHLAGLEDVEVKGAALAERLQGRIPVIYASTVLAAPVARVIKIKFNENGKMAAFWGALPEVNHNEMVGYTRLNGPFTVVLLDDPSAPARVRHRLSTTAETLAANGVPVERVRLTGASVVEKAFGALFLFDFVSCALALAAGIDPNPVVMVEDFKAGLGPFTGLEST